MPVDESTANAQKRPGCRDEEYLLTEAEAHWASVLALMTGFSQGCCTAHRAPMARRVADQLDRMAQGLDGQECSGDMRHFLQRLGQRWATVAQVLLSQQASSTAGFDPEFPAPQPHWHHSPETLQ